jgi:hypothetical protein
MNKIEKGNSGSEFERELFSELFSELDKPDKPPLFADWCRPVFDGPQPRVRTILNKEPLPNLNAENAGE